MRMTLAALLLLAAASQAPAPLPMAAELSRVRADAAQSVPADQRAGVTARLDRARTALDAGRTYLAFYLLESAYESTSAFAFAGAAGAASRDDFLRKWTDTPVVIAGGQPPGMRPAIVDAIAAAAEGRAPATYRASRPYAEDAGVEAGLFYLGQAHAFVKFAAFARGTRWPDAGRRPAFRSIAPELAALDADMTRRYESMTREEHPTYIAASAALKEARGLDAAGRYDGALFEYLLARYLFAPLRGPAVAEATAERIAAARASLASGLDHSVAELFLQFAGEGLAGTMPAQRRGAAAVLDDVLPAYVAAVAPPAATTAAAARSAAVTITLVRWPFT